MASTSEGEHLSDYNIYNFCTVLMTVSLMLLMIHSVLLEWMENYKIKILIWITVSVLTVKSWAVIQGSLIFLEGAFIVLKVSCKHS
jgi:predicted ferric reductase